MLKHKVVLGASGFLALTLVVSFFAFLHSSVLARSKDNLTPVTSGNSYDRNAEPLDDGSVTWLFFARTEQPCNRLTGCANDESTYDLYYEQAKGNGGQWGPATLLAVNPVPANRFYGRTIAPVRTADGTIYVFWASGGNSSNLYYLTKAPGQPWSSLSSLTDAAYFNVEAVAVHNTVFVYYQDGSDNNVYVRTLSNGAFSAPTQAVAGLDIPKVLIDKNGVFRMTLVDGNAGSVYVASSQDGRIWSPPSLVVSAQDGVTDWDPVLAQTANGRFYLYCAPDLGLATNDVQHIVQLSSDNFTTWTQPTSVTPGTDGTTGYWDYWPEALPQGNQIRLFYTSEATTASSAVGVGHIWEADLHLDGK